MDFTLIIIQLIITYWYLIPFVLLSVAINSAWFKGTTGEFVVNLSANLFLDKQKYHLIKNVTLPTDDGTTQIDHIIVSKYGLFVVETKNMKGWIFGNPNQKIWTQKIFKHSSKFQNPLHQNYKHVKTLESFLGLQDYKIFSVVVFIGDNTFKTEMPENVTYGKGYIRYIKTKTQVVLNEAEVTEITNKIKYGRLAQSFKTTREHVKHVSQIVSDKEKRITCPSCGGSMILIETKQGQNVGKKFWGCSTFPKCRGIVNVA